MYILGISCYYHDAAAALIKDGKIVAAAEEERFTRTKHDTGFPFKSIEFCLKEAGIKINKVDYIVFYDKPLLKFERLLSQHLEMFPKSYWAFFKSTPEWLTTKLRVQTTIRKKLKYNGDILFSEHHLSHAASSFFLSPFKEAAILTVDGVGEWATTTFGVGKGTHIKILKEIHFPHSLGLLYSAATAHLGFKVNSDEYKVMGLAPYGKPKYYDKFMKKVIRIKPDGSFEFNMDYFVYHYKLTMPSEKYIKEFGPVRKKESPVEQKHKDLAASLQKALETVLFKMLNDLHEKTGLDNLCMAGGVALNSVANGKILKNTPFKDIFIQPAASDAGTSMGAAYYVYNHILKKQRNYVLPHAYWGPGFTDEYVKRFLKRNKIKHTIWKNDDELVKHVAQLLVDKKIVGWFQGRMEWGPRALGNRSILASACSPDMKDILNAKVKHREMFRPFAPVVTLEDAPSYFDIETPVEYMLYVYPIKKDKQKLIPAVTHVDGSGRLQTITKEQNRRYYQVIKEFEKLTGIPILVNTSFNIRGEPIVCTPEDAYRCMMGTGIDYLVFPHVIIARADNPKHMWDSEAKLRQDIKLNKE